MRVYQLIDLLRTMPVTAKVLYVWDGEARSSVEHVWVSKDGEVIFADDDMYVFSDGTRPVGAPDEDEVELWTVPDKTSSPWRPPE